MNEKNNMRTKIHALSFAVHELVLFLDTHPQNRQAMELLREFRKRRDDAIAAYEARFGRYIETTEDVEPTDYWNWIDSPWPWEKED